MEKSKMNSFISDRVDYKGGPADRTTTGGWVTAALIVGTEVSERLSTMGVIVNLVTYLNGTMHLSSTTSSNITSNVAGASFLLCLLGGILADSFLGRYWTITIFALIHALGTCMLAVVATLPQLRPSPCNPSISDKCEEASSLQMGILYAALYSMALGVGGIKASVSGFGTDQFDQNDDKEMAEMAHFFNRFYLIISFGTLMAVTVLVYVQDEVGRNWGYGICSASMFLAISAFLVGTKRYRYRECAGSPIIQILQVLVTAIRKRKAEFPLDVSFLYEKSDQESRIPHTDKYRCLDKGTIITGKDRGPDGLTVSNPWALCSVTKVEEVKMLTKILPIMTSTIIFWTIRAQLLSFSVQQCATMERSIGNFVIPPASFNGFFVASTIITLVVYDRLIMPFWKQSSKGVCGFTSLQKVGIAIFFSILGMAAASLVEIKRLSVVRENRGNTSTLPITSFLLLPQFILVGIGDGFMYTGQLDFFITESPKGMKAISTGLFLTTNALGFFGSSILVTIVKEVTGKEPGRGWLLATLNDSRLDCFYALLAVLGCIDLGLYLFLAASYKPNPAENAMKTNGQEKV